VPVFTYPYSSFVLEVTAPNEAAVGMRQVGDGRVVGFDDDEIIVDFGLQRAVEGRAAVLDYRILRNGVEIFASSRQETRHHIGGRRISNDPITYSFRKAIRHG